MIMSIAAEYAFRKSICLKFFNYKRVAGTQADNHSVTLRKFVRDAKRADFGI